MQLPTGPLVCFLTILHVRSSAACKAGQTVNGQAGASQSPEEVSRQLEENPEVTIEVVDMDHVKVTTGPEMEWTNVSLRIGGEKVEIYTTNYLANIPKSLDICKSLLSEVTLFFTNDGREMKKTITLKYEPSWEDLNNITALLNSSICLIGSSTVALHISRTDLDKLEIPLFTRCYEELEFQLMSGEHQSKQTQRSSSSLGGSLHTLGNVEEGEVTIETVFVTKAQEHPWKAEIYSGSDLRKRPACPENSMSTVALVAGISLAALLFIIAIVCVLLIHRRKTSKLGELANSLELTEKKANNLNKKASGQIQERIRNLTERTKPPPASNNKETLWETNEKEQKAEGPTVNKSKKKKAPQPSPQPGGREENNSSSSKRESSIQGRIKNLSQRSDNRPLTQTPETLWDTRSASEKLELMSDPKHKNETATNQLDPPAYSLVDTHGKDKKADEGTQTKKEVENHSSNKNVGKENARSKSEKTPKRESSKIHQRIKSLTDKPALRPASHTPDSLWDTSPRPLNKKPVFTMSSWDESHHVKSEASTRTALEKSRFSTRPSKFTKSFKKEREVDTFRKFAELGLEPRVNDMKDAQQLFQDIMKDLELDAEAKTFNSFFPSLCSALDGRLPDKFTSLLRSLELRAAKREYGGNAVAAGRAAVVLGAGPCGLRLAIELQLLGATVTVIEKREEMTRNNVLRLWPFVMEDLKSLGLRKLYPQLELGTINHISIRLLQIILFKVCLLLGIQIRSGESFKALKEPMGEEGWVVVSETSRGEVEQGCHMVFCATGSNVPLEGFSKKKPDYKMAIAVTANFRRGLKDEGKVEELAGLAFHSQQEYFTSIEKEHGIGLENIVYFKDLTNYFVMTVKKGSLLENGILRKSLDKEDLLSEANKDMAALRMFAVKAAGATTENNPVKKSARLEVTLEDLVDVSIFNFSELYSSAHACRVVERGGRRLLVGLVGDSLMQVGLVLVVLLVLMLVLVIL